MSGQRGGSWARSGEAKAGAKAHEAVPRSCGAGAIEKAPAHRRRVGRAGWRAADRACYFRCRRAIDALAPCFISRVQLRARAVSPQLSRSYWQGRRRAIAGAIALLHSTPSRCARLSRQAVGRAGCCCTQARRSRLRCYLHRPPSPPIPSPPQPSPCHATVLVPLRPSPSLAGSSR